MPSLTSTNHTTSAVASSKAASTSDDPSKNTSDPPVPPPKTITFQNNDNNTASGTATTPSSSSSSRPPPHALRVLICSGNLGNAAPDAMSAASWIPHDGDIERMLKNTDFPLTHDDGSAAAVDEALKRGQFDIVVIGMQEATFSSTHEEISTGLKPMTKNMGVVANFMASSVDDTLNIISKTVTSTTEKVLTPLLQVAANEDHISRRRESDDKAAGGMAGALFAFHGAQGLFGGTEDIHRLVTARHPSYECPVHFQRGEIRLIVLVRKSLMPEVSELECQAENTGIGNVFANKGGIVTSMTIRKTRLCFITAHLAAHEGDANYKARCDDIEEILEGARVGPSPRRFDVSVRSHHCFIFGDLNFRSRIVLPPLPSDQLTPIPSKTNNSKPKLKHRSSKGDDAENKHRMQWLLATDAVGRKDWAFLNDADELLMGLEKGDCLADFSTLPCHFPPTFKVKRDEDLEYNEKRIPSYTDRILWKSADNLESSIQPILYEPCLHYVTSDHKPIRGAFVINTNVPAPAATSDDHDQQGVHPRRPLLQYQSKKLHVLVENISCTNLKKDSLIKGPVNPFVTLITTPTSLCSNHNKKKSIFKRNFLKLYPTKDTSRDHKGFPRTRILKNETNPDWKHYEIHLTTTASSHEDLEGAMLHITVLHYDSFLEEHVIGSVTLNMQTDLFGDLEGSMKTVEIHKPLMKNGLVKGQLKCTVVAWWLFDQQRKTLFESRRQKQSKKGTMRRMAHSAGNYISNSFRVLSRPPSSK